METFRVVLDIRAECDADARELINDYTGEETDVNILSVEKEKCEHIFDDMVGYGITCVKCGIKGTREAEQDAMAEADLESVYIEKALLDKAESLHEEGKTWAEVNKIMKG